MKNKAYITSYSLISPLGSSLNAHEDALHSNTSGINVFEQEIYGTKQGGKIANNILKEIENVSPNKLENLLVHTINETIQDRKEIIASEDTLLIVSTTKGNINSLSQINDKINNNSYLNRIGSFLKDHFKLKNDVMIISNACISGSLAAIMAQRFVNSGKYNHVLVAGGDIFSNFVVSGFNAFMAISNEPCKPFDKERNGISLGEGAGCLLIEGEPVVESICISGGGTANDANHISGPSRDGLGLRISIERALKESQIEKNSIDFISAHGTATPYNDEMECQALYHLGFEKVPVNSFKSYFGHTLGAAGILEIISSVISMKTNTLIRSIGYSENGLTKPLNIIEQNQPKEINTVLKLASGFGGCNAALILQKT